MSLMQCTAWIFFLLLLAFAYDAFVVTKWLWHQRLRWQLKAVKEVVCVLIQALFCLPLSLDIECHLKPLCHHTQLYSWLHKCWFGCMVSVIPFPSVVLPLKKRKNKKQVIQRSEYQYRVWRVYVRASSSEDK